MEPNKLKEANRFALVIGNQKYKSAPLRTPVADSIAVATKLRELGFDVDRANDCNKTEMREKLKQFNDKLTENDVALLYYSGHAFQVNTDNWLLATDSDIKNLHEIEKEATNLAIQLQAMQVRNVVSLVFLDACRDNPFSSHGAPTYLLPRSAVEVSGPSISHVVNLRKAFIAFSAEPGRTADDGIELSPFTSAFVERVGEAGLEINQLMQAIQNKVEQRTNKNQFPRYDNGLRTNFYFVPKIEQKPLDAAAPKPEAANDLVVLFGGEQAERGDLKNLLPLEDALKSAPAQKRAMVKPWMKGEFSSDWNLELEEKLLVAKKPLLVEYRSKADPAKEDSRVKVFLYKSAGAQTDREDEHYEKSNKLLEALKTGDRLAWKPVGATPEDLSLDKVDFSEASVFAPYILRRLGVSAADDNPLPCIASQQFPGLGKVLARSLGNIVGVKDEPQWSAAMKIISFKRAAGNDELKSIVVNRFTHGQANVVAACEQSSGKLAVSDFLKDINSRVVDGQRLAEQRFKQKLCIVRFLARVDTNDESESYVPPDDGEEWFVLKYTTIDDRSYKLINDERARDWFVESAKLHGINLPKVHA